MNGIRMFAALAVLTVVLGATSARTQDSDRAAVALQRAIHVELVDGDLQAAILLYEEIAARFSAERAVAATALRHLGQCYEKLGEPAARAAYERVLRDYAEQAEQVAEARGRLAALDVERAAPPTLSVREFQHDERFSDISGPGVTRFALSGDGQTFVYTDWPTGDLAMTNMATGEVRRFFGTDWATSDSWFETPVFSPDEERVAFVRYPNRNDAGGTRIEVSPLNGETRETVYEFGETASVFLHDWSPDGTTILLAADAADGSRFLATLDLEHKMLRRVLALDWQFPRRAQYSPDGHFITYDSTKDGDSKIYLISPDGAHERVLVDSSGDDDSPLWTRDGRFLLFRSERSGTWDLYALPMQDGQADGRSAVVMSLGEATHLRGISHEGQLFYSDMVDGRDIAIAERINQTTKTAPIRVLPKVGTTEIKSPSFSPDGGRLAYLAGPPGAGLSVRITDLQGSILKEIPLDRRVGAIDSPRFSPDGKNLAFRAYDAGEPRIMAISVETGTVLKVFSPYETGYARVLGWTQDGRHVYAVPSHSAGGPSLDTIDVETEQVVASTALPPDVERFSLSPSGESLLMLSRPDPPAGQEQGTALVLRSLEDGSDTLLTEESSFRFGWDFDSRHVLYMKGRWGHDDNRLYSLSLDTGEETLLVDDMQDFNLAAVSPDGKYWARQNGDRDSRMMVLEHFLPAIDDEIARR